LTGRIFFIGESIMADDRTIIVESPSRGRSGSGWIIALVLVVALIVGAVFIGQMTSSQTARNDAIANAAQDVGQAARNVGAAARNAGDAAQTAARNGK